MPGTDGTWWCPILQVHIPRFRWLLPLCNLALDMLLFAGLVHVVDVERGNVKRPPPLWHQVQGSVDPGLLSEGHLPRPLVAIISGTLPAALVASLLLPNGWQASSPFDFRWASLYLALAAPFWYTLGRYSESGHPKLRRVLNFYILLRIISVPMEMSFWGNGLWVMLSPLLLAWSGGAAYLILLGVLLTYRRLTRTPVQ